MTLDLNPDQLTALRKVVPTAEPLDLEVTYGFPHPLNISRELCRAWLDARPMSSKFRWHIRFFEANRVCILEDGKPVARNVSVVQLVCADHEGIVATNDNFFLDRAHAHQRFATALYAAEWQLFKRWGVREIHMHAQRDGLVVWMKPQFGFQPVDRGHFRRAFQAWKRSTAPEDPVEYPEAFLRTLQDVYLYKVIAP